MNIRLWAFAAYYVLAAALIAFVARGNLPSYYRLSRNGVEAHAQVTGVACKSNTPVIYRFVVDGVPFDGSGDGGYGNPPCETIKSGDPFVVFYLPSHPEINIPGNPGERIVAEGAGVAMAALALPVLALFIFFLALRATGKKPFARRQ